MTRLAATRRVAATGSITLDSRTKPAWDREDLVYAASVLKIKRMDLGTLTSNLSPLARIGIAAAPLLSTVVVRLLVGKNRALEMILMGSATWLAMNTVTSPYMDVNKGQHRHSARIVGQLTTSEWVFE